jgi:pyruvate dehydrogenase complex dehydrogenase (E1) component
MGLTDILQDSAQRGQIEDFVKRYDQGQPWEGISDDEARQQHDQVAAQLDDRQYEESARESIQNLEPERRREFARELGVPETDDPQELARETARVHKEKPDMLGELMNNPAIKGAVAGIAAQAAKRFLKR